MVRFAADGIICGGERTREMQNVQLCDLHMGRKMIGERRMEPIAACRRRYIYQNCVNQDDGRMKFCFQDDVNVSAEP